jgi:predicted enzyme related to lactoylglutathione lyase
MQRVTGIGGVFFKSRNPQELGAWYKRHLGIDVQDWGGAVLRWQTPENPTGVGTTTWSPFSDSTDYFAPSGASFMINYRVENLRELLAVLKTEGVQVVGEPQESEYGVFGWVLDPEGNKLELWQPPTGQ